MASKDKKTEREQPEKKDAQKPDGQLDKPKSEKDLRESVFEKSYGRRLPAHRLDDSTEGKNPGQDDILKRPKDD